MCRVRCRHPTPPPGAAAATDPDDETMSLGSNLWHTAMAVSSVGLAMHLYNGSATWGAARGRELLESSTGLLHAALNPLADIVAFLDVNYQHMSESEIFASAEYGLLALVVAVIFLDAVLDLSRFPALDRVVTLGLRQAAIRFYYFLRLLVRCTDPTAPILRCFWTIGGSLSHAMPMSC